MYKILGADGTEYGPISTDKLKQWIKENRVEPKTPVMPDGAKEWIFVSSLPEFAGLFPAKSGVSDGIKSRRLWQLLICLSLLLVALIVRALFILGKIKHH